MIPKKPEPTQEPTTEPKPPVEIDSIRQAREMKEGMDKTLEAMKEENDRTEKMHADNIIAGKGVNQAEAKEETPKEYSERILKGET